MRILDIALKDLWQIWRDRKSLIFLVVMPLVFTFFMGMAYSSAVKPAEQRLTLGWDNRDPGGRLSEELKTMLGQVEGLDLVEVEPQAAADTLLRGKASGVLVIPAGFSAALEQTGAEEAAPQLVLLTGADSNAGQTLFQLLRVPATQLASSVEIARLSTDFLAESRTFDSQEAQDAERTAALEAALAGWRESSAASEKVVVERGELEAKDLPLAGNPYNQSSPGILVQFAIFGLISSAQILVTERKTRTLQRLRTTAVRPWEIIGGHLLAMFTVVFLQTLLLVAFGQAALKVNYLREPLASLLVGVSLGLWVSALGMLIGMTAKEDEQVIMLSMIAMFLLSALGGAWFPLEGAGRLFAALGKLTPAAWAIGGFQDVLVRGQGVGAVLLGTAIQLLYAGLFFGLALWKFRTLKEA